jgi:translation initiation factor IF-2
MPKYEINALASEWQALPSQIVHVLSELGERPTNGTVELDADTLNLVREAVSEMVAAREVALPPGATPRDIAHALNVSHAEVQKQLFQSGVLVNLTTSLAQDVAERLVQAFGYKVRWVEPRVVEEVVPQEPVKKRRPTGTTTRPPVVTILGHVDHGKTTLLDFIRRTKVAEKEYGGITQHIGAYEVEVHGRKITFLDTPGHEAFTAMRARGAQVTDIAVLVVAADDGVMPQTVEAINHAKSANVPIIVAINKIDLPEANANRVKQQLTEYGLISEDYGGDTIMVPLSAKTGEGVDTLLDLILLQADLLELKADPSAEVQGVVIEARLDRGRGPVATVLVENGTLKQGDIVVVGKCYGRIKAMFNFAGERVKDAGPSTPVEIIGLDDVPEAGDRLTVYLDEREAKSKAEELKEKARMEEMERRKPRASLAELQRRLQEGERKELNLIIKADVQGSVEAVRGLIEKIEHAEVTIKVLHSGVGTITESDVLLASAADAIIVGFNTRPEPQAKERAEREGVEIRTYKVIYDLVDDIEKAIRGLLEPKYEEQELGRAVVRAVFQLKRAGTVAGCYVKDGKVVRGARCRVLRDGKVIAEGTIASLRHLKEDVREIQAGYECGLTVSDFTGYEEGDEIQVFELVQVG